MTRITRQLSIAQAWLLTAFVLAAVNGTAQAADEPETPDPIGNDPRTVFLENYCFECHDNLIAEAELNLQTLKAPRDMPTNAEVWQEVVDKMTLGDMPPSKADQPTDDERVKMLELLRGELAHVRELRKASSEVVLRRLNREEYNNTMRDLTGLDLRLGDRFPADIAVDGFDNVGEALTLSPYLLEQYLKTAKTWLDTSIETERAPTDWVKFYPWRGGMGSVDPDKFRKTRSFADLSPEQQDKQRRAGSKYDKFISKSEWNYVNLPHEGWYRFRLLMSGRRSTAEQPQPRVRFIVAAGPVAQLTIPSPVGKQGEPRWYEFEAWLPAGIYNFRGEFLNPEPDALRRVRKKQMKGYKPTYFQVHWADAEGPLYESWPSASTRQLLPPELIDHDDEDASARRVLERVMRRAWRRPVASGEIAEMVELFAAARPQCETFEEAIQVPLSAVLTSPHFLYLVEPRGRDETRKLDDHELATRLSYFLWSSTPDERLLDLADAGKLRDPDVLTAQLDRMLANPKAAAFAENFVGQWLRLRTLGAATPDDRRFPRYNRWLEQSMRQETLRFFEHVVDENLSVLNFVDSDFAILNDALAQLYGVEGVDGAEFRKVVLPNDSVRGGVLTQASILTLTADGVHTSPVHRGTWILESFLNMPPPPPPPSVPELDEAEKKAERKLTTIREKLAAHRASPACSGCHSKIDPLGFALESFDAVGAYRTHVDDRGEVPTEPFGKLPDGTAFDGPRAFKKVLLDRRRDVFLRAITTKLMTYALGRPVGFADRDEVDRIVARLHNDGYRMRTLLREVVTSEAFLTH